jgi:hypothetical protein
VNVGPQVDHDRFCRNEEWDLVRNARGAQLRHHVTHELALPDGRILRTRISRPVSIVGYGQQLWATILRDQLDVTESEFWACVKDKVKPDRGSPATRTPANALPAPLVHQLVHQAHVPEEDIAGMTLEEALHRMREYWSKPPS